MWQLVLKLTRETTMLLDDKVAACLIKRISGQTVSPYTFQKQSFPKPELTYIAIICIEDAFGQTL